MKRTLPFITAVALCCGCIFGGSEVHDKDLDSPDTTTPDATGDSSVPGDADNNVTPDMGPPGVCDLVDCEVGSVCNPMTGRCDAICPAMQRFCGDRCLPVASDILNCGSCDNRCEELAPTDSHPRSCTDGTCVFECDAGFADLDDDLNRANSNGCESDCVPSEPPGEVCDGVDNDCNGFIDDQLPTTRYHRDFDGDGYGDEFNFLDQCGSGPSNYVTNGDDCDDFDVEINPDAAEVCDGIENDCDPTTVDADLDACAQTVFLTSTAYAGDLATQGGPDAVCQTHGATRGARYGTWRAIATVGGVGPILRIRQIGEIKTPSGVKLWDAGDMFSQGGPSMPIVQTETLGMIPDAQPPVWTGSGSSGVVSQPTCSDWTTNDADVNGRVGVAGVPLGSWLDTSLGDGSRDCSQLARLYCIDGQE